MEAISSGKAVLALASRGANRDEIEALEANSLGNLKSIEQENILALDALVLVTSPGNPVRSISEEKAALVLWIRISPQRQ